MPIINERFMKLVSDYTLLKCDFLTSDDPQDCYNQTLKTLNEIIIEIDPRFFWDKNQYTDELASYNEQLAQLVTNGKVLNLYKG